VNFKQLLLGHSGAAKPTSKSSHTVGARYGKAIFGFEVNQPGESKQIVSVHEGKERLVPIHKHTKDLKTKQH
jgi:hypothetical protein